MNVKLFKQKDFSLLMLGKLISFMGTRIQNFALSLYVLKLTGSAAKFASVLAVTFIPEIILGPIAGVFVDWFDRKKIIVSLDMIRGIIVGIYAFIFILKGELSLGDIYVLVISISLASLIFQPAVSTVIPSIVKKEDLVDANGINSVILNLGNLAAPAIGGILFGLYGILAILVINAVSFILSSVSEMFIDIPKTNKKPEKISFNSFSRDFLEGIKFIKNKRIMFNIILLGLVLNFVFPPLGSMGRVYISKEILKVSDSQYGISESIFVIAMLIAPFLVTKISKRIKLGKIIFLDIVITSILGLIMALIPSSFYLNLFSNNFVPYISMIVIGFMIGLITSIGNIAIYTMFQKEVHLEVMGRVSTVMNTGFMAAIPFGQMIFGVLFDKIEAWICISLSSVILFVTIMIFRRSLCSNEDEDEDNNINNTEEKIHDENDEYTTENENLVINSPEIACSTSCDE